MREVRRARSWVVGIWLVCQLSALAAVVLAVARPMAIVDARVCTCPPGTAPADACPMHHSHDATRECALKNASSGADAVLLTLLGTPGLIPPAQAAGPGVAVGQVVAPLAVGAIGRSDRPESPPPRS